MSTSLNAAVPQARDHRRVRDRRKPGVEFDPVTAAPLDANEEHLLEATHLHNAAWAAAMSGSGAMSWWWGAYIHSVADVPSRATGLPGQRARQPAAPRLPRGRGPRRHEPSRTPSISAPASVVALGLDNGTSGFAWIRDAQNEYGTGARPGDLAGRTMSGVRANFAGFTDGTYRIEVHDPWGTSAPVERLATSVGGTLIDRPARLHPRRRPEDPARRRRVSRPTRSPSQSRAPTAARSMSPSRRPRRRRRSARATRSSHSSSGSRRPPASTATPLTLVFTIDKALSTVSTPTSPPTPSDGVPQRRPGSLTCTAITTDPPATPDPCVGARGTLTVGTMPGTLKSRPDQRSQPLELAGSA